MKAENIRARLRAVLLTEDETWHGLLEGLLSDLAQEPKQLHSTLALLVEKRPLTGARHLPRLDQVIEAFRLHLRSLSSNTTLMRELAVEIARLEDQRLDAESRLSESKALVGEVLGPNVQVAVGDLTIKTGPRGTSLKVVDPSVLPAEFRSEQPDRKAILRHHRDAGENVPGTVVTRLRPSVRVDRRED